ncbi:MAG TPA: hypothetical protein DCM87_20615 [Planctomycetes bacterium]|nr:hypothetical protein [Planctomycetota bacterium]
MPTRRALVSLSLLAAIAAAPAPAAERLRAPGPETRPWAYWWWLGSAVDKADLTRELERYRDAGMGGVHIIPIYGAKGCEARFIEYLSPAWLEMLAHAVKEARRLGMDADMTTGTGWCFGGPTVSARDANARFAARTFDVEAGGKLPEKLDRAALQALVAFSRDGRPLDLAGTLNAEGLSDWVAEGGPWRVYAVSQRPSGRMVKRAAPGGAGHMLNPFAKDAIRNYLVRFTEAFDRHEGPLPRAMYHDSYEYVCDWSPDLLEEFEARRGYRLQDELPAFLGEGDKDRAARVKCDYRETVADMMADNFTPVWAAWARARGMRTRNQAHGSPGNLLDLYAAADIPETEMFNKDRDPLVAKFASSAAHVAGRRLVAAETGTWLAEHFNETLGDLKKLVDLMFVSGVNHVIYHGTCYSPDDAAWPGWLFYASTEMNPRNSIWRDAPALNAYVAHCQAVLQSSRPDNDILLYWPIHDLWHDPEGTVKNLTVHGTAWLHEQPLGALASRLWKRGYTFDYVSERQLAQARARDGGVEVPGGRYRAVLVPACTHMPPAVMESLCALAADGATVIFQDRLPADVPGLARLEERRAALRALVARCTPPAGQTAAPIGKGRVIAGDVEAALAAAGIAREELADDLVFIRRALLGRDCVYFIANQGAAPVDRFVMLATPAASAVVRDLRGAFGLAAMRRDDAGRAAFRLQLAPGESRVLTTYASERSVEGPWRYEEPAGAPLALAGTWKVEFVQGGPALPASFQTDALGSWASRGDAEAERFAGTARYTLVFDAPERGAYALDLGTVCHSARVRLNGRGFGTLFAPPFRAMVGDLALRGNVLEVEVTNLSANRIRDLDRRKVPWKIFHDINFVDLGYKPFDASAWPLKDSGLLGPVTITKLAQPGAAR